MKVAKTPRHQKSWHCANIILEYSLVPEFRAWCYQHPKVKSMYRAGNLFLIHRRLRYASVKNPISVNMDSLLDYYFEEPAPVLQGVVTDVSTTKELNDKSWMKDLPFYVDIGDDSDA